MSRASARRPMLSAARGLSACTCATVSAILSTAEHRLANSASIFSNVSMACFPLWVEWLAAQEPPLGRNLARERRGIHRAEHLHAPPAGDGGQLRSEVAVQRRPRYTLAARNGTVTHAGAG